MPGPLEFIMKKILLVSILYLLVPSVVFSGEVYELNTDFDLNGVICDEQGCRIVQEAESAKEQEEVPIKDTAKNPTVVKVQPKKEKPAETIEEETLISVLLGFLSGWFGRFGYLYFKTDRGQKRLNWAGKILDEIQERVEDYVSPQIAQKIEEKKEDVIVTLRDKFKNHKKEA